MNGRFLKHVLAVVFMVCGFVDMNGQEISKADILATLSHMKALAQEQKADLLKAQTDFQQQGKELLQEKESALRYQAEAHENAKERDSMLICFALAFATWAGTMLAGIFMREFPTPWNVIGLILAYVTSALFAYAIGRLIVANLARFIP